MALCKCGKWRYGDSQADIRAELVRYGKLDDEEPTQFAERASGEQALLIMPARGFGR